MKPAIYRAWVNQPSTLQPLHRMHGMKCIVYDDHQDDGEVTLYFTDGPIHSMQARKLWISRVYLSKAQQ
jgi:hypothetical protein